jgi:excisionase family DNA binding protein
MSKQATPAVTPVMTVAVAARKLGVTPQTIYRWLEDGCLERYTAVEGETVLVVAASVERFAEIRLAEATS